MFDVQSFLLLCREKVEEQFNEHTVIANRLNLQRENVKLYFALDDNSYCTQNT